MTHDQHILTKLQEMPENDFTKQVFVPLLSKMGLSDVQFHGGTYEEGKDFIAVEQTPFGDFDITVGQVKRFEAKQNAKSRNQFSEIIFQLRQCREKKVPYKDGVEHIPKNIFFVTPFVIATRILDEQFENLVPGPIPIRVIDGAMLIMLLKKYMPTLIESLLGLESLLEQPSDSELVNYELLDALSLEHEINYEKFYSDLSFFVGNFDSNLLIDAKFQVAREKLDTTYSEWVSTRNSLQKLAKVMGFEITNPSIDKVIENYNISFQKYTSTTNKQAIQSLNNANRKFWETKHLAVNILNELGVEYREKIKERIVAVKKGSRDSIIEEFENILLLKHEFMQLVHALSEDFSNAKSQEAGKEILNLVKTNLLVKSVVKLREISRYLIKLISLAENIRKYESAVLPAPTLQFSIKKIELEKWINSEMNWYKHQAPLVSKGSASGNELKAFLSRTEKLLIGVNTIRSAKNQLREAFEFEVSHKKTDDRFSISAHEIIDSGANIAIYGEAGAGKTTTLQMYVKKYLENGTNTNKIVLYFPLNRLIKFLPKSNVSKEGGESSFEVLLEALIKLRRLESDPVNIKVLSELLHSRKHCLFIFDGIDEIVAHAPWILDTLNSLSSKFENIQVVVSSRDCVSYLDKINFLGITLLPFTRNQLYFFIDGWLEDEGLSSELKSQIEHKNLFEVVKNPLLATIVCGLVKSGIELPQNEADVYRKRLDLLTGNYDNHKKIKRIESPQQLLQRLAREIAYGMHCNRSRESIQAGLIDLVSEQSRQKYPISILHKAVFELIDPCNILRKVPGSDTYTFGHLRIQEFLVSEEILLKGNLKNIERLADTWWRGVFYLYAFECDVSEIIDQAFTKFGSIGAVYETLMMMAEAKPDHQKASLKSIINLYKRQDDADRDVVGMDF